MPETSTERLAEDVDTAIRDVYHALRTALHRVEDLKMNIIRRPNITPFGPEHDEIYKMYLDLSKRFQETREEVRNRSDLTQPQPPAPGPAPRTDEPRTGKPPFQRSKSRPYVLVPPRSLVYNTPAPQPNVSTDRRDQTATAKTSGILKGKRKAAKSDEPSRSESEKAVEDYLSIKRMKTRHSRQEADVEILAIEDSERDSSPLTELPSSRPVTPPILSHQPEVGPAPSKDQTQRPGANLEGELPAPNLKLAPVPTRSLAATESRTDDAKPPANTDKKPKLKGKKKAGLEFTMDDTLLDKRLLAVGPDFEVDNDRITHHQVGPNSRATMSRIFGGNPQRMISYPSPEKRRAHGFTSPLLFPSRSFNPHLPTKIGERGLLFRLDQKLAQWVDNEGGVGPYHLMMHHASDDYCYFGVYEFVRVDPVTNDEWLAQSSQVRDNWANHALKTNTGEQTRARVFLRRELGREPTKTEVGATKKDKSLKGRVTMTQIMEDFNSGSERLVIWGMKCIGYNYDFERYLADNLEAANAHAKGK